MQVRLKPTVSYDVTDIDLQIAAGYTVSIDIAAWVTTNSEGPPKDGAMPVWDGEKLIWSSVEEFYLTPDGDNYLQPDGVSYYFAP
jgi:hypothetical protein